MSSTKKILVALLAVVLAVALAGCENLLQEAEDTSSDSNGEEENSDGEDYDGPTGSVSGEVRDATTGDGVGGASVSVEGYDEFQTTSNSDGSFSLESPTGSQTLVIQHSGYDFGNVDVEVSEDETTTVSENEAVGNPTVDAGQARIVLTWDEHPRDLDSHLLTPDGEEIYYVDMEGSGANLDVDDVTSYGPETITLTDNLDGTYVYFVYKFAGDGPLSSSGATVKFYDSEGLVQTFTVPESGTGRYWNVFTFEYTGDGYDLNVVDELQSTAPTL